MDQELPSSSPPPSEEMDPVAVSPPKPQKKVLVMKPLAESDFLRKRVSGRKEVRVHPKVVEQLNGDKSGHVSEEDMGACKVCLERNDLCSLKCGHIFCRECIGEIQKAVKKAKACPICRKVFNLRSVRPLFL